MIAVSGAARLVLSGAAALVGFSVAACTGSSGPSVPTSEAPSPTVTGMTTGPATHLHGSSSHRPTTPTTIGTSGPDRPADYFQGTYTVVGTVVRLTGHPPAVDGVQPVIGSKEYHARWRVVPEGSGDRPPVSLVELVANAGRVSPPIRLHWDGARYTIRATSRVSCGRSAGTAVHTLAVVPTEAQAAHPSEWTGRTEFTSCAGTYVATLTVSG